jgi:hypothetical protein
LKQNLSPGVIAGIVGLVVVLIGAIGFFAMGGKLGGSEPTQESLGIGGGVKPGELPDGVKYHDLGDSAGPNAGKGATTGSPTGPGK